ncbi:uncharacterized protein LOC144640732 [Oculina patagonica]
MKVPGACIKAGFFWMNAKGKQLYVLNSDQDLSEAKRAKTNSGEQNIIRLAVVVDSDNMRDQKGKKSTKRCLMKNSPSTSKRVKTDIDNDHDDEVYEKFVQGINTDSKNENSKWNEVHIDLRKKLEKIGTLDRFGVVHLSLWTDLIINGTVSGVEEEPDWSKYRHITSVDPLPRKGARLSISRTSASSSQDMLAALILQQEARREDDKKLEAQRRQEQERKWEEKERINREQHLMTMSIISKAFLPGMPSTALHPVKEVVHSEPSTSKETGLLSMTVAQVSDMLKYLNLGEYINLFEKESIDGAMLSFLNMEGLVQLGITNALHASRILGHVAKLKSDY